MTNKDTIHGCRVRITYSLDGQTDYVHPDQNLLSNITLLQIIELFL